MPRILFTRGLFTTQDEKCVRREQYFQGFLNSIVHLFSLSEDK